MRIDSRMAGVMILLLIGVSTGQAIAQSLVEAPVSESPHWSHINVYDFGRALPYIGDATAKAAAYDWFTQHIDMAEAHGNTTDLTTRNAALKTIVYRLDLSTFAGPDTAGQPESYFLHFSENTELRFMNMDGSENATITLTGCPEGTPATLACRVQSYIWTNRRYIYNLSDAGFRTWKAQELLTSIGSRAHAVFLDEHGPGFVLTASWGNQVRVLSGGGVREFNGQRFISRGDAADTAYNDAMVAWLGYLAEHFKQAGKRVILNPASYGTDPMVIPQIQAANGVSTEFMHRVDAWAGAYHYQQFQDVMKSVVNAGGIVDLHGTWCYGGPSGYTRGNYSSALARYHMWRLASYYLIKEPVGSSGLVYFDPAFCSNVTIQPQNDQVEWLTAYQANIGQPVGDSVVSQEGTAGRASTDGRACAYKIWARAYTKATVFVRPKDMWDCTDYSDTSAATVTLATPGQLVKEDGTLEAQTSSISLRNGEAVIVYHAAASTPVPAPEPKPGKGNGKGKNKR